MLIANIQYVCTVHIYSLSASALYVWYVFVLLYIAVCIFNLLNFLSDSAHQGNKTSEAGGPGEEPVADVCWSEKDHDLHSETQGPATCQLQGLVPQSARFGRKPCTSTADANMVIVSIIVHIWAGRERHAYFLHAYN